MENKEFLPMLFVFQIVLTGIVKQAIQNTMEFAKEIIV